MLVTAELTFSSQTRELLRRIRLAKTMADDIWREVMDVDLNGAYWSCRESDVRCSNAAAVR